MVVVMLWLVITVVNSNDIGDALVRRCNEDVWY